MYILVRWRLQPGLWFWCPPDQRRGCSKFLNLNGLTAFCFHDRFIIVIHRARHGEPTVLCAPLPSRGGPSMEATRWHLAPRVAPYKYACLVIQKKCEYCITKRDSCCKNARLVFQKRKTRVSKTRDSRSKNIPSLYTNKYSENGWSRQAVLSMSRNFV